MEKNYDIRYVALYLRKSRGEEEDLIKHETILIDMCKKNDWKYVIFKEIATSDSIELRPIFQKLLEDIQNDIYDAVLVVDYDRLSRGDMGQQDKIKKIFQKSETLIITPNKLFNLSDDMDDTYAEFSGFMARQEYKMITKRLRQGKKIGSRLGNWTNGTPPYTYAYERFKDKYNSKGLVVNQDELPIYNYIIAEALKGVSPHSIAWDLNKQGIKTRKGKLWSNVSIYRILINETYLGKIISNKQKGDGHIIKKSSADDFKRLPKDQWIIVENCHEAIISQENFDKIQIIISKRNLVPVAQRADKAEFTGILKCACCGHTMQVQKKKDGKSIIKGCSYIVGDKGDKCINRGGALEPVKNEIKKAVLKYREDVVNFLKNDNYSDDVEKITKKIQIKYKELRKYEEALIRATDSFDLGDYTREEFLTRKEKWKEKINSVEEQINLFEKELKQQKSINDEQKISILDYYLENIDKISDIKDRNKLYKTILESVIWRRIGSEESELEINFL